MQENWRANLGATIELMGIFLISPRDISGIARIITHSYYWVNCEVVDAFLSAEFTLLPLMSPAWLASHSESFSQNCPFPSPSQMLLSGPFCKAQQEWDYLNVHKQGEDRAGATRQLLPVECCGKDLSAQEAWLSQLLEIMGTSWNWNNSAVISLRAWSLVFMCISLNNRYWRIL